MNNNTDNSSSSSKKESETEMTQVVVHQNEEHKHSKPDHPVRHTHRTYYSDDNESRYHNEFHHPRTPKNKWNLGCFYLDKECISYFVQMIVLFCIIAVSLYKVSTTTESKELWISLLSSCMGYILPAPTLKKDKS